jgi:hypothetical protein
MIDTGDPADASLRRVTRWSPTATRSLRRCGRHRRQSPGPRRAEEGEEEARGRQGVPPRSGHEADRRQGQPGLGRRAARGEASPRCSIARWWGYRIPRADRQTRCSSARSRTLRSTQLGSGRSSCGSSQIVNIPRAAAVDVGCRAVADHGREVRLAAPQPFDGDPEERRLGLADGDRPPSSPPRRWPGPAHRSRGRTRPARRGTASG